MRKQIKDETKIETKILFKTKNAETKTKTKILFLFLSAI